MPEIETEKPLGRMLSSVGKSYLHLLRTQLQYLDIDRNYYALVLIENQDGIITQQELALLLETDKVSVVRVVDYLTGKGYIKRVRKTDDKRKQTLVLTSKAKEVLPEIKRAFTEINEIALMGFSNSQVLELAETISRIKRNITENIQKL
jgi:DNA-binding MarR family transcriptional regulator